MGTMDDLTPVVFRVWRRPNFAVGEVVALFPTLPGDMAGRCTAYEHIGQHGAADYAHCLGQSRPASADEAAELRAELEQIGYRLRVYRRRPARS